MQFRGSTPQKCFKTLNRNTTQIGIKQKHYCSILTALLTDALAPTESFPGKPQRCFVGNQSRALEFFCLSFLQITRTAFSLFKNHLLIFLTGNLELN